MRQMAEHWYRWRWSQIFYTDEKPPLVNIPDQYAAIFPMSESPIVTVTDLEVLCQKISPLKDSLVSIEAMRLLFLLPPSNVDDAVRTARFHRQIVALHRTRARLHAIAANVEPYWGDLPEGEWLAQLRSQFMIQFAPGLNLAGIVGFYEDVSRRVNRLLLAKKGKKLGSIAAAQRAFQILEEVDGVLGLLAVRSEAFLELDRSCAVLSKGLDRSQIEQMVSHRVVARIGRDWVTADRIQQDLNKMGIMLQDSGEATDWWVAERCDTDEEA